MQPVDPPRPNSLLTIQIDNFPVRLWWKLLETAQQRGVPVNYLVFSMLALAVGYQQEGESYDLLIKEIDLHFDGNGIEIASKPE